MSLPGFRLLDTEAVGVIACQLELRNANRLLTTEEKLFYVKRALLR